MNLSEVQWKGHCISLCFIKYYCCLNVFLKISFMHFYQNYRCSRLCFLEFSWIYIFVVPLNAFQQPLVLVLLAFLVYVMFDSNCQEMLLRAFSGCELLVYCSWCWNCGLCSGQSAVRKRECHSSVVRSWWWPSWWFQVWHTIRSIVTAGVTWGRLEWQYSATVSCLQVHEWAGYSGIPIP